MDGTNQKCKSRKRSRETDRSATTRTRVGGLLSVSYHSCSDKDPATLEGATNHPNHCSKPSLDLYSMDSAYSISINKMRNGGERKRSLLKRLCTRNRTNADPEEWVWAFEKMNMQRVRTRRSIDPYESREWMVDRRLLVLEALRPGRGLAIVNLVRSILREKKDGNEWEDWSSLFISRKELVSTSLIRRTNKKRLTV
ncbi:hypothetical protein L1887_58888 [Cichorium endivia]|nr:hypothetical protein L1887_58888 [Cichorium endivia]